MQYSHDAQERYLALLKTTLGPAIMQFLQEPHVIEIMVNSDGKIWIDSLTQGKNDTGYILDAPARLNMIKLTASYHHLTITPHTPELACELPFYPARFQAWIAPVVTSPTFTIRKKATQIYSLSHYIEQGWLSKIHATHIQSAIKNRFNILIAGGTASGKTTFANAILHELSCAHERICTLEDVSELQIQAADSIFLRKTEQVSMQQLVKGCLRMRPDRIIMGEVRDGAALDLLKAWNTGHSGGLCTIHANSAESVLARLESLILEVLDQVPKNLIQEAVDLIIFMQKNGYGDYQVKEVKNLSTRAKQLLE